MSLRSHARWRAKISPAALQDLETSAGEIIRQCIDQTYMTSAYRREPECPVEVERLIDRSVNPVRRSDNFVAIFFRRHKIRSVAIKLEEPVLIG